MLSHLSGVKKLELHVPGRMLALRIDDGMCCRRRIGAKQDEGSIETRIGLRSGTRKGHPLMFYLQDDATAAVKALVVHKPH
jgi:hypothetical protein